MPTPVTRAVPEVGTDPLEIKHAAAHYGVVRLRERMDGPGPFVALLEKLGPLMFTHGETPVDGFEQLNIVSNKGRKTPPKSVFHSDTSYVARPPVMVACWGLRCRRRVVRPCSPINMRRRKHCPRKCGRGWTASKSSTGRRAWTMRPKRCIPCSDCTRTRSVTHSI